MITGTTSQNGNLQLELSADSAVVLLVIGAFGSNQVWTPFVENDGLWRAHGSKNDATHAPIVQRNVTVTVWYETPKHSL